MPGIGLFIGHWGIKKRVLYIISTPIGNLKDITLRGLETLQKVHLIAAEDTRHIRIVLNHYQIRTSLTSYFEHNQFKKGEYLLGLLKEGKDIALVTDSGTPGISDPGFHLIRLARDHDIPITIVPGPTALIAALSLSGLPMERFIFEGFLPAKSAARRKRLELLREEQRTVIVYESPHRILKTLSDIQEILGDPQVVSARELTKRFEEVKRAPASQLIEYFKNTKPRGEFVLLWSL